MPRNLNIWDVFWANQVQMEAECTRKVAIGRRVAGAIWSLVHARDLQFECTRVLHETLFVPVLMYLFIFPLLTGGGESSKYARRMIHAGRKKRPNGPG